MTNLLHSCICLFGYVSWARKASFIHTSFISLQCQKQFPPPSISPLFDQPSASIQQNEARKRKCRVTAMAEQRPGWDVASRPSRSSRWASSRLAHRLEWMVAESPLRQGTQQKIQMLEQNLNQHGVKLMGLKNSSDLLWHDPYQTLQ